MFTKPVHEENNGGHTTGCCRFTYFEYDICKIQEEERGLEDVGKAGVNSKYSDVELQEIRSITRDEINAIKRLIKKTVSILK